MDIADWFRSKFLGQTFGLIILICEIWLLVENAFLSLIIGIVSQQLVLSGDSSFV